MPNFLTFWSASICMHINDGVDLQTRLCVAEVSTKLNYKDANSVLLYAGKIS